MATVKAGARVRILTREPTEEDAKAGTYFAYFGGLTGTVQKVYSKQEVAVEVEQESLTREVRKRHEDVRHQMKTKWLDGLSEEGKNRLTEREKDFLLRYVVLVAMSDLEKAGAKPKPPAEAPAAPEPSRSAAPARKEPAAVAQSKESPPPAPQRRTIADLEAAEEAELARRKQERK